MQIKAHLLHHPCTRRPPPPPSRPVPFSHMSLNRWLCLLMNSLWTLVHCLLSLSSGLLLNHTDETCWAPAMKSIPAVRTRYLLISVRNIPTSNMRILDLCTDFLLCHLFLVFFLSIAYFIPAFISIINALGVPPPQTTGILKYLFNLYSVLFPVF